ncbi:MAG TPA: hypothetical protein DCP02_04085 [Actinobacteria bacterium]|nr:hypothetical protein [Actinomycetota bacterium]
MHDEGNILIMMSYDRVMTALSHNNPDRPPVDYIATLEMNEKLKRYINIEDQEELLDYLGVDMHYVNAHFIGPEEFVKEPYICSGIRYSDIGKDFWGIERRSIKNKFGTYDEITYHPLAHVKTLKEVEEYRWPDMSWFDMSHLKKEINYINEKERHAIIFFAGSVFETSWYMRGFEQFLMDLVECPEIAVAIVKKVTEFYKDRAMCAIEASDGQIDIIRSGGDLGAQGGMILSPELWRKYIKQWSRELIKPFKEMGLGTFYHSCGSIVPVIEDFIEMGLDILDPIQPEAKGMDPEHLKDNFGSRLSFHGGIDEQKILPRGTTKDVEEEVLKLINILGNNGGYIVAPSNAVQPDTPVENVLAMFRTAREYKYS